VVTGEDIAFRADPGTGTEGGKRLQVWPGLSRNTGRMPAGDGQPAPWTCTADGPLLNSIPSLHQRRESGRHTLKDGTG
jgi:hypothetical protein